MYIYCKMYESMYIYISDGFSIVLIVYVCGCPFFLLLFLGSTNAFSILHYFFCNNLYFGFYIQKCPRGTIGIMKKAFSNIQILQQQNAHKF